MNLREMLQNAMEDAQGRKTSFGREHKAASEVAAEAAKVALERLQKFSEQRVELEGMVRGAEYILRRAEGLVENLENQFREEVARTRNELAQEREQIRHEREDVKRLLEVVQAEREATQVAIEQAKAYIKSEREEALVWVKQRLETTVEEQINESISRRNVGTVKPGNSPGRNPGPESGR